MSILLRKECQVALDAAKLPELHVDVIEKTLTIVGKCGQPLVAIGGIRFATSNPKKAEHDYAVELFDIFLTENLKDIQALVAKRKALKAITNPKPEDFGLRQRHHYNEIYPSNLIGKIKIKTGEARVYLYDSGTFGLDGDFSDADLTTLVSEIPALTAAAKKFFTTSNKHKALQEEVDKLAATVASCDI